MSDCVGRWKANWDPDNVVLDLRENGGWQGRADAGIGFRDLYKAFKGHWVVHHKTNMLVITQTHYRLAGIWLHHDEPWCEGRIKSVTKRAILFEDGSKLVRQSDCVQPKARRTRLHSARRRHV